ALVGGQARERVDQFALSSRQLTGSFMPGRSQDKAGAAPVAGEAAPYDEPLALERGRGVGECRLPHPELPRQCPDPVLRRPSSREQREELRLQRREPQARRSSLAVLALRSAEAVEGRDQFDGNRGVALAGGSKWRLVAAL